MYSTNNRSVITFTFYNCCCRCRCRCRWYCCMWLLIWLDSAVKTIHRMNLIYLLTTHSLSLILTRNIALFSSILFCSLCVRSCFLRAQNVKNSEMCKWNGRTNIKHRWKKNCTNNTFDWYEWNLLYPLVRVNPIQIYTIKQASSRAAAYICRPIFALKWCRIEMDSISNSKSKE